MTALVTAEHKTQEYKVDAFIFDFDGVVANVNIQQALEAARPNASSFLIPPHRILIEYFYHNPQNTNLDLGLITTTSVRETMRPNLWCGEPEVWLAWWQAVEDAYQISAEMSVLLQELQSNFCLGLLTDNHSGFRQWLNKRPDINQYFDVVICSAEVGIKKPAKTIFELTVQALGTTFQNVVYLDDDASNVDAARTFGIPSIHFQSVKQAKNEISNIIQ
jgi:FMN phosphatase YigB (HAD superfamily)